MVKHTQTIRREQPTNCLSVFDHLVGSALKGLSLRRINELILIDAPYNNWLYLFILWNFQIISFHLFIFHICIYLFLDISGHLPCAFNYHPGCSSLFGFSQILILKIHILNVISCSKKSRIYKTTQGWVCMCPI